MKRRRVVITGIGVVAPNGIGKEAFWEALVNGRSGIGPITRFDASAFPSRIAGEIGRLPDFVLTQEPADYNMGRQTLLACLAAEMAITDAGLQLGCYPAVRKSTCLGACIPAYDLIEPEVLKFAARGPDATTPRILRAADPSVTSSLISRLFDFRCAAKTFSTSCNSGLSAIGDAFRDIQLNRADLVIAGAADSALSPVAFASFCRAGMLSSRNHDPKAASRPFDLYRDGGVLSEGAGVVILEEYSHAVCRGAHMYAEVLGYATTAVSVNPAQAEDGFIASIIAALEDSNVSPDQVDYISAHGPSDPHMDKIETQAIKRAFGRTAQKIAVSSIKSMIGNPLSAAGPIQVISTVLAIEKGMIPPTINYEFPDPACDLDYVPNKARRASIQVAMVNGHGLNGTDSCLVMSRAAT